MAFHMQNIMSCVIFHKAEIGLDSGSKMITRFPTLGEHKVIWVTLEGIIAWILIVKEFVQGVSGKVGRFKV